MLELSKYFCSFSISSIIVLNLLPKDVNLYSTLTGDLSPKTFRSNIPNLTIFLSLSFANIFQLFDFTNTTKTFLKLV